MQLDFWATWWALINARRLRSTRLHKEGANTALCDNCMATVVAGRWEGLKLDGGAIPGEARAKDPLALRAEPEHSTQAD